MLKFNKDRLRKSHETPWFVIDFIMLGLLILNLALIIFDALYLADHFRSALNFISPAITVYYLPIHNNFALIDLGFISLFFTEFCIRWVVSVKRKEYVRWFFFPFIHWYDLVGCIPLEATRIFRFLRLFSILYRLHKYKILDISNIKLFQFVRFYYDVFMEELSDRIVVKVLSDVQKDIDHGSPLLEEIRTTVIVTRLDTLSIWGALVLQQAGESLAHDEKGRIIRAHVKTSVSKAVRENVEVSRLKLVPMLGSTIEHSLETAVSDIVIQSVIHLLTDMNPHKLNQLFSYAEIDISKEENTLDKEILVIVDECIELLKKHVSQQQWKTRLNP